MTKQEQKLFVPVLGLFAFFSCGYALTKGWLVENGFNFNVLMAGNLVIFLTTLAALYFHVKGFLNKNVQAFLRSVYGALMIKMFVCAIAVVVYAFVAKKEVNKPAIFVSMAMYIFYSFIEVRMIFRLLKQVKNQ